MINFKKEFPSLKNLRYDIPSGLVVFLVALPLCLGIALASGAPLLSGILSGLVGGIIVGAISGSPLSVSGPANTLMVVVLAATQELQSFPALLLAIVIAGVLQIIFGLIKAGSIADYFPSAVIKGMLAAIGIILILKQIPHAFGYDADFEGDYSFFQTDNENSFTEIFQAINKINLDAIIISTVSLIILIIWNKPFMKRFSFVPAPLVVVGVGIGINHAFAATDSILTLRDNHLVQLPYFNFVGGINDIITTPFYWQIKNPLVWKTAVTIAIIASIETLLSIDALDRIDPEKRVTDRNRELVAQGVGNIVSGMIGGLPITSVIVRSSVNINAGGKTKYSTIFHGIFLAAIVILFPDLVNQIPLASLAAILIMVGYRLCSKELFIKVKSLGKEQFFPFVLTIFAILFTDLLLGITIGMLVGLSFILRRGMRKIFDFGKSHIDYNAPIIISLPEEVTFLNKTVLVKTLNEIPDNTKIIINGSNSYYIDYDVVEALEEFKLKAEKRNIEVELRDVDAHLKSFKRRSVHVIQDSYKDLFINNKLWVSEKLMSDPEYFVKHTLTHNPKYLYIGCSDNRVLPTEITGTDHSEVFVHRNIANIINPQDLNFMAMLEYAINELNVEHIIVCGHYGCQGICNAMVSNGNNGTLNAWLSPVKEIEHRHKDVLTSIEGLDAKANKLVELNVHTQLQRLKEIDLIKNTMASGRELKLHSWVYDIGSGYIKELEALN